jgi:hypothetical protein
MMLAVFCIRDLGPHASATIMSACSELHHIHVQTPHTL